MHNIYTAADFNISSELTFTFPANSTDQQCLSLNITSDGLTEDTETFNLGISVISPPLIATSGQPATVTINNTDSKYHACTCIYLMPALYLLVEYDKPHLTLFMK